MLKNASVGERIFWKATYFDMDEGFVKTIRERAVVVDGDGDEVGTVPEEQLNSIARKSFDEVVAESEVANHETRYMIENSQPW